MALRQVGIARVKIAAGQSLATHEVDLREYELLGVQMPASWDTANLTFKARPDLDNSPGGGNDTPQNVYDSTGTEVVVTVDDARFVTLNASHLASLYGIAYLTVRSGTSGSAVVQSADRELLLLVQPRN